MKKTNIEFRKLKFEDISRRPEIFNNEHDGFAKLELVDMYGVLFPDGLDEKPIWFIRHCNPDKVRFGSFHRPGDGFLGLQEPLHHDEIAQKETTIVGYNKINESSYGISSVNPYFEYVFSEDGFTFKEANILDIKAEPFPNALIKHADHTTPLSQVTQSCTFSGYYKGKPVQGIGNFELIYFPEQEKRNLNDFLSYIHVNDIGVREDGRKEFVLISYKVSGDSFGFYWLEGEEPVVSYEVMMEAEWVELPYATDGTCIYENAKWTIGDKVINFNGKWGAKGLTSYPRLELSGQSQVFGTWYEGETPYKHKISMTFHENMGVYSKELKKNGFTLKNE